MGKTAKRAVAKAAGRDRSDGTINLALANGAKPSGEKVVLRYGSATLEMTAPHDDWARNIELGQIALGNLGKALAKPGVALRHRKSTPLFRADPADPQQLIRLLDGKEERGIFEDGEFKVRG